MMHLDNIYHIQGLLPDGVWMNGVEYYDEFGVYPTEDPILGGGWDDTVVFLRDVTVKYSVEVG